MSQPTACRPRGRSRWFRAAALTAVLGTVGLTAATGPVAASDPTAGITQVKLSLRGDPATSVAVSWRDAATAGAGRVQAVPPGTDFAACGTVGSACVEQPATRIVLGTSEGPAYAFYQADVTGLRPATTYRYRVVDGGAPTQEATFATAGAGDAPFSAAVVGEVHVGDEVQPGWPTPAWPQVAAQLAASSARFVLSTGDNVNTGWTESEWERLSTPARDLFSSIPYLSAVGNHETYGSFAPGQPSPYFFAQFPQPRNGPDGAGGTFSFDYQGVHVVVLEANPTTPLASLRAQVEWLKSDLSAARRRTRFQMVITHSPLFHSKQSRVTPYENPEFRDLLVPVFDRYGVELVVSGHDKHYVRSYPLQGAPDPGAVPHVKPKVVRPGQGTTYLEVTSTGQYYADFASQSWMRKAVPQTSVTLKLRFGTDGIEARAIQPDGRVVDAFTIAKVR
ncbi:MAG: metallophosphoesterase family protein [Actinobacteria bacterium]|nr:metallophosphoesterase family protein [Actinomycetota bacterium]